jgi:hypothetical protein
LKGQILVNFIVGHVIDLGDEINYLFAADEALFRLIGLQKVLA